MEFPLEDIRQGAPQTCQDLLEPSQRDALLATLQAVQRGLRQPDLPREFRVSLVAALSPQELGKLFFQTTSHDADAGRADVPFAE